MQAPLSKLAEDSDLHVRELAFAARQYAVATAEQPTDFNALYNHGLVLQELSTKLPAASADQAAMLRQVRTAQACTRRRQPALAWSIFDLSIQVWGVCAVILVPAVLVQATFD